VHTLEGEKRVRLETDIEEELLSSRVNSSIRFCGSYTTSILFSELVVVSEAWAWMLHLPEANLLLLWDPCMLHSPLPDFIDLMPCLALLNNKACDEEDMLLPSGRRDALVTVACKLVKA
jgi:hypothetical protein